MSAGWVAGSVRARALGRRRQGPAEAAALARSASLEEALRVLSRSPYGGQIRPGQSLGEAQHAVAGTVLWDLRVLAGWLPRGGVPLMRALAGWFELANVDELLAGLTGGHPGRFFELGALATAWPQLRAARSPADLRTALAASAWGDPGRADSRAIRAGMRARWAARMDEMGGEAAAWAAGGMALLAAAERYAAGRDLTPMARAAATRLLGLQPLDAATLAEFAARLPASARWALAGVAGAEDLWRAEAAWWARVEADGVKLLRGAGAGSGPVLGAAAVLAADARRVRAALEMAARGGAPMDAYDAVA